MLKFSPLTVSRVLVILYYIIIIFTRNGNGNVLVNAPYLDSWPIESKERMVFLGGHPAKYWPPTSVCAVCECVCVYCLVICYSSNAVKQWILGTDGLPWWPSNQVLANICWVCMCVLLCLVFIIAVHLGSNVTFYPLSPLTSQVTVYLRCHTDHFNYLCARDYRFGLTAGVIMTWKSKCGYPLYRTCIKMFISVFSEGASRNGMLHNPLYLRTVQCSAGFLVVRC